MEEKIIETLPIQITIGKITEQIVEEIKDGARTDISLQQINTMPTIERNLRDYVRLVPQLSIIGDGISVAGMNNRYNTIYIDGAVNNDVYGLATAGTNGGQTGISPLSPDAIEQITVNVSPYDVSIGGFAGGSINAVTRSGSNQLQASAYSLFRSQRLAGTSPDAAQTKLDAFTARTSGFRIGAPIIKDKLFLFLNAEVQRDETPHPFDANTYLGASSVIRIDSLTQKLGEYGYNP
jgi:outer membrane receptor for ferrienterochelin and colicin